MLVLLMLMLSVMVKVKMLLLVLVMMMTTMVLPSKFVVGYSDQTLILDVDLGKLGTLLGLTNSTRDEKLTRDISSLELWKKFLLLPLIILGNYCGEMNIWNCCCKITGILPRVTW
jgi:hypothetical protein